MDLNSIVSNIRRKSGILRLKTELKSVEKARFYFKTIADEMLAKTEKPYDLEKINDVVILFIKWLYMIEDEKLDFTKGILLKGHTGKGKTFIFRILQHFVKIDNVSYIDNKKKFLIYPRIVNVKQISGEFQDPEKGGYRIIQKYAYFNCLVLDDIGKEQAESKLYGNNLNVVEEIINIREERGLLTFGTTNLNRMSEMYDDRTISRMHQLFNIITVNHNKDFRKDS